MPFYHIQIELELKAAASCCCTLIIHLLKKSHDHGLNHANMATLNLLMRTVEWFILIEDPERSSQNCILCNSYYVVHESDSVCSSLYITCKQMLSDKHSHS